MLEEKKLRESVELKLTYIYPSDIIDPHENYAANASVILVLMEKTRKLLELYGIKYSSFSKDTLDECIRTLFESIKIDSDGFWLQHCAIALYGEGQINYLGRDQQSRAYWKKNCPTASDSAAFLMWYILQYRMEIEWYERYDCHTAEHILAAYSGLWFHITYYPEMTDRAFHLLVKNVCVIVFMNCLEFLNSLPQHVREIEKNIY